MISKELADPSDLFIKYRKSFFSIVLSLVNYKYSTNLKTIKAPLNGLSRREGVV